MQGINPPCCAIVPAQIFLYFSIILVYSMVPPKKTTIKVLFLSPIFETLNFSCLLPCLDPLEVFK